ncbi:MAG: thrombospondin type 3 repeat-containing protein [Theionarchaea archaeon]|nr:MAG: hypothetical protein AYK18_06170 [Theionarchaea archaeon DG-70]MBU7009486.1 thrombospondin type 3 repeat-containing protein [Theionarchaea archaeon]
MKPTRKMILILVFLGAGLLPIVTAPAPTATTLPAASVTQTSAVLQGKVNPHGLSTNVDFCSCDPSASPTYFLPTPLKNIGSGTSDVLVTYTLTGLSPGKTYSYTVRSVNSAGSQNGSCVTFTTLSGGYSATLSTSKPDYALGETVFFTLTNTGPVAIPATVNNPWTIYKKSGATWQTCYVPGIAMQNWTLNPGNSKTWSWGQSSNAMVTIDAGTYKAEVDISGVGTWSTTFTIGMGGGGGGTGSLRIYCNISDYDIYIDGSYFATAATSTVTLPNLSPGVHQVRLTKSDCQDVVQTVTIQSGITTSIHVTMNCGQEPTEEDEDGDGVPNAQDHCYNPECNLVDSRGCPKDTDNDGVNECEDDCPREKGPVANDGCPIEEEDKDNDGVSDDRDSCYNPECDIVDSQGCPKDTDDDGIDDCKDECPSEYGERQNDGCPEQDVDNDGVPDDRDSCYNPECSRVDPRGCPLDSDGDGLNDCEDNCPGQSGSKSNNGCPQQGFCSGTVIIGFLVLLGFLRKF